MDVYFGKKPEHCLVEVRRFSTIGTCPHWSNTSSSEPAISRLNCSPSASFNKAILFAPDYQSWLLDLAEPAVEKIFVAFYRFDEAVDRVAVVCSDAQPHRLVDRSVACRTCLVVKHELD